MGFSFEKPQGYDEVQTGGDFTPIELGGHKLVIKKLEEVAASNGNKYLKVSFDTALDDKQPNYYAEQYKNDTRDTKKWGGVATLFPTDQQGKTSKTFKQFCTSIERSNNSTIQWGAGFEESIVGKKIGGVFGEEEYLNAMSEVKTARKLFWWRSTEGLADANVPEKRMLAQDNVATGNDFYTPDNIDEELPFN
jgi:hypothetical protein